MSGDNLPKVCVMYKTLFHATFICDSDKSTCKTSYLREVYLQVMLPFVPFVGFWFCPDMRREHKCCEWKAEEVIYDLHSAAFIVIFGMVDAESEAEVNEMAEEFIQCGWKTENPLQY